MIDVLLARLRQGYRTIGFPNQPPTLPDRYRGYPVIDSSKCGEGCKTCVEVCPTDALSPQKDGMSLDLGRCLACTDCASACPSQAITHSRAYSLAARKREELVFSGEHRYRAEALSAELRGLFGRSLKLRQVSAGGCNGCEADINVLANIVFDLGRFGIQVVASPRHADGLLITGPIPENMKLGLQKTYDAIPTPKIVIAVGACAISGGPFVGHPEVHNGASSVVPVDLFIPGCPPHPITILDGLLRLVGRIKNEAQNT